MVANSLAAALEVVARTDPGLVRGHNEDSVYADAASGLVILADGMGGYNAGEVASSMATALLARQLEGALNRSTRRQAGLRNGELRRYLVRQIEEVNATIYQASADQSQFGGMGTTLVTAVFSDNRMIVAHVGDSRLYRLRGRDFVQLTRDHSLLQEQIESGLITAEEARYSLNRNLVTRAIGVDAEVDVETHVHHVEAGDIYLLCSDGLYDMVEEADIRAALERFRGNPELAARRLVKMANDSGGEDNISVIVVRILREFPAVSRRWTWLCSWFH